MVRLGKSVDVLVAFIWGSYPSYGHARGQAAHSRKASQRRRPRSLPGVVEYGEKSNFPSSQPGDVEARVGHRLRGRRRGPNPSSCRASTRLIDADLFMQGRRRRGEAVEERHRRVIPIMGESSCDKSRHGISETSITISTPPRNSQSIGGSSWRTGNGKQGVPRTVHRGCSETHS